MFSTPCEVVSLPNEVADGELFNPNGGIIMEKHSFVAKIGFTKVLDLTCPKDGGLYSSNEKTSCPKCNARLVSPTRKTDKGPIPFCLTEVTFYPMLPQEVKDSYAAKMQAAGGLPAVHRFVLYGYFDGPTNTLNPDARTRYLVPKRTIRLEFNTPPQYRPFTGKNGDGLEIKFVFSRRYGDEIEFLDAKQEFELNQKSASPDKKAAVQMANDAASAASLATGLPASMQIDMNNPMVAMMAQFMQMMAPQVAATMKANAATATATKTAAPQPNSLTDDGSMVFDAETGNAVDDASLPDVAGLDLFEDYSSGR